MGKARDWVGKWVGLNYRILVDGDVVLSGIVGVFVTLVLDGSDAASSNGFNDLPRVRTDIKPVSLFHNICRGVRHDYDVFR